MSKKRRALVIFLISVLLLAACGKSTEEQISEYLELGQRYLTEQNYEEAIVALNKVIELDSKEIQAYTYLIQAYQNIGSSNEANEMIQTGLTLLPDELDNRLGETQMIFLETAKDFFAKSNDTINMAEILELQLKLDPENIQYQEEIASLRYPDAYYSNLSGELETIYREYLGKLKYLYEIYVNTGTDSVKEYLKENNGYFYLDNREDVVYGSAFIGTDFYYGKKIYYGDTNSLGWPSGVGIALCNDNGTGLWIYVGNWKDGKREGDGSYFSVNRAMELSSYDGEWSEDKPNGNGSIYVEQNESDGNGQYTGILHSYEKWIGTFVNGYYHGDFVKEYSGPEDYNITGHIAERLSSFEMGKALPIPEGSVGYVYDNFNVSILALNVHTNDGYLMSRGCEICIESQSDNIVGVDLRHFMPEVTSKDYLWTVFGGFKEED